MLLYIDDALCAFTLPHDMQASLTNLDAFVSLCGHQFVKTLYRPSALLVAKPVTSFEVIAHGWRHPSDAQEVAQHNDEHRE